MQGWHGPGIEILTARPFSNRARSVPLIDPADGTVQRNELDGAGRLGQSRMMTYTLYSMQSSGNCYKPRLLMHQLGLPFRLVETDAGKGETRTPAYLALNPNGKVPLLVLPDGRKLSESNAMLLYLAEGTRFLPDDRYQRALVHQWLFFEQYDHEPAIAVARSWLTVYPDRIGKATPEQLADWHKRGNQAALGHGAGA